MSPRGGRGKGGLKEQIPNYYQNTEIQSDYLQCWGEKRVKGETAKGCLSRVLS